jgi:PIN domain nuclease of toxin-antitoxin system
MKGYLLDTCTLIWYLENDKRVRDISEEIEYYQEDFAISMESLKELVHLIQINKINLDINFDSLIGLLNNLNIEIIDFSIDSLKVLFSLPVYKSKKSKKRPDPTDRHIIATAIAKKRILISGDEKFKYYKKDGLLLMEI